MKTTATTNALPMIDGAELMRLAREGVMTEAEAIRRELSKAVPVLNAAAIVALAMAGAPGESAAVAVDTLKRRVSEMLRMLSVSGEELKATQLAEQARLSPLVAAAGHRVLEIEAAVANIAGRIRSSEGMHTGKRDRLMKAGLSGAALDSSAAPFDPTELQAERAALLVEQDALEQFIRTRDPRHIPDGFAEVGAVA